jgi:hypothetical protein
MRSLDSATDDVIFFRYLRTECRQRRWLGGYEAAMGRAYGCGSSHQVRRCLLHATAVDQSACSPFFALDSVWRRLFASGFMNTAQSPLNFESKGFPLQKTEWMTISTQLPPAMPVPYTFRAARQDLAKSGGIREPGRAPRCPCARGPLTVSRA